MFILYNINMFFTLSDNLTNCISQSFISNVTASVVPHQCLYGHVSKINFSLNFLTYFLCRRYFFVVFDENFFFFAGKPEVKFHRTASGYIYRLTSWLAGWLTNFGRCHCFTSCSVIKCLEPNRLNFWLDFNAALQSLQEALEDECWIWLIVTGPI